MPEKPPHRLVYNPKLREYVVFSNDVDKAEGVGLKKSTSTFGPNGETVWFTDTPYAAMPYYEWADEGAKAKLASLHRDYEKSWQTTWDGPAFPCPEKDQRGKDISFMPYQNAGIAYGLERENVLIADEPGLGKTAQAIGICNATEAQRVLIVCPGNIRLGWRKEIHKWSTLKQPRTYPIMKSSDGVSPSANFVIPSYEMVRNEALHDALVEMKWDVLVIDEAHYLKERNSQRSHAVFGGGRKHVYSKKVLSQAAKRVICLTGTPLPNRPRECYTIANALNPESIDYMSFEEFSFRFNPSARGFNTQTDKVYNREERGRLPELQARLRCNFMIRRMKKDVLKDLPDKRYELTYIEPDGKINDIIRRERMLDFSIDDLENPFAEIWGQISTIRREMGEAKLPRAIEHIRYLLDVLEIPKVVVFSHHRSVMDILYAEMGEKYGVCEMRGGMSSKAKEKAKEDFIGKPECRIFSGQMDSAGVGIDGLQEVCDRCVIIEASWVPGVNEQAVDRLHRNGQHGNVVAEFIVVEGSLDERVLAAVLDKTETIHSSLDDSLTKR